MGKFTAMKKTVSVVRPDVLKENRLSINTQLKNSYSQVKKQIEEGISAVRNEWMELKHTAEACMDMLASPVNNHLKDTGQIERDFNPVLDPASSASVVPITEAISTNRFSEENY
jgi:hypothetical protein